MKKIIVFLLPIALTFFLLGCSQVADMKLSSKETHSFRFTLEPDNGRAVSDAELQNGLDIIKGRLKNIDQVEKFTITEEDGEYVINVTVGEQILDVSDGQNDIFVKAGKTSAVRIYRYMEESDGAILRNTDIVSAKVEKTNGNYEVLVKLTKNGTAKISNLEGETISIYTDYTLLYVDTVQFDKNGYLRLAMQDENIAKSVEKELLEKELPFDLMVDESKFEWTCNKACHN